MVGLSRQMFVKLKLKLKYLQGLQTVILFQIAIVSRGIRFVKNH